MVHKQVYDLMKNTFVKAFDKYNFVASFENHVHNMKRTFPLTESKVNTTGGGVVYLGDGSWVIFPI